MEYTNLKKTLTDLSKQLQDEYEKNLGQSSIASTISISIETLGQDFQVVLSLEDYWKYIEEGRKPGTFPKVDSLVKWVKKKNLPLGGKIKTPEQMAFVIGKHIEEKGIPGKHILEKSMNSLDNIEDTIAEAFAQDLEEYLINTI